MKNLFRMLMLSLGLLVFGMTFAQDKKPQVDFIYFGSSSCSFCLGWVRFDLPALKKNAVFEKIVYTSIEKPVNSGIPGQSTFPAHIAPYRDAIANAFKGQSASPMFAILVDGKVTWHALGTPDNNEVIGALTSAVTPQGTK